MSEQVLGATLALSGVVITLLLTPLLDWWKESLRNRAAKRERQLVDRRDAYLGLVTAFADGINLLPRIVSCPPDQLHSLQLAKESSEALARKDLIASGEVLEVTALASKAMMEAVMRMMVNKTKEALVATDIGFVTTRIDELNHLTEEQLRRLDHDRHLTPQTIQLIEQRFARNNSELESLFPRQEGLLATRNALLKELGIQQFVEMAKVAEAVLPAVIALRKDLEVDTDEARFHEVYALNRQVIADSAKAVVGGMWDTVQAYTEGTKGEEGNHEQDRL